MPETPVAQPALPAPQPSATEPDLAPGGPTAQRYGCVCSVLANAAYRRRRDQAPLVDPACSLHAMP